MNNQQFIVQNTPILFHQPNQFFQNQPFQQQNNFQRNDIQNLNLQNTNLQLKNDFHPPPFQIHLPQVNFSNVNAPELYVDCTLPSPLTGVTYTIKKLLGSGAFGSAYKCFDNFNQPIVIKVAKPNQTFEKVSKDFEKEVKLMQSLNHSNIVRIFDAFVFQNRFCMVLEECEGSMRSLLEVRKTFSNNECVDIAAQILSGLHQIHTKKIIHRDLHLDNLLYLLNGNKITVKIHDFGISKWLNQNEDRATTQIGRANEEGFDMPPELVRERYSTYLSDIYQVGLVLYHLYTGTPAISSKDGPPEQVIPSGLAKARAIGLETILGRSIAVMLRRTPQSRFNSCFQAWDIIKWAKTPSDFKYQPQNSNNPIPFYYISDISNLSKNSFKLNISVSSIDINLIVNENMKERGYVSIKIEEKFEVHSTEIAKIDKDTISKGASYIPFYLDFDKFGASPNSSKLRIELYQYVHPDYGNDIMIGGTLIEFKELISTKKDVFLFNRERVASLKIEAETPESFLKIDNSNLGNIQNRISFGSIFNKTNDNFQPFGSGGNLINNNSSVKQSTNLTDLSFLESNFGNNNNNNKGNSNSNGNKSNSNSNILNLSGSSILLSNNNNSNNNSINKSNSNNSLLYPKFDD